VILVTGAAGKTGKAVIGALVSKGEQVRALVHRQEQVDTVLLSGVKHAVVGDMQSPNVLIEATSGVSSVYHICSNMNQNEVQIGRAIIAAAKSAKVTHFVFHSVLHPQAETMPHHWNKLRVEEALFESHLSYTIMQPASYMQNILANWREIVERGVYSIPYSVDARMSMVDLDDVAEAAANVLTEQGHAGATYELAGPEALTQTETVSILTMRLGREVRAERLGIEEWKRRALNSGLGPYQIDTLIKMFEYYDRHGFWGNSRVLSDLIHRPPTKFERFVQRITEESVR
jgi:NAD(P)H dehydrogenase (quinone)